MISSYNHHQSHHPTVSPQTSQPPMYAANHTTSSSIRVAESHLRHSHQGAQSPFAYHPPSPPTPSPNRYAPPTQNGSPHDLHNNYPQRSAPPRMHTPISKRPATAHHVSYSGHQSTSSVPSLPFPQGGPHPGGNAYMSNAAQVPSLRRPSHAYEHPTPNPAVQVPSQLHSRSGSTPRPHPRVQSMSAGCGNPNSYISSSYSTLTPNGQQGHTSEGMYAGQSSHNLSLNTLDISGSNPASHSGSYCDPNLGSSLYPYQGPIPSHLSPPISHISPQSPLSPLTPQTPSHGPVTFPSVNNGHYFPSHSPSSSTSGSASTGGRPHTATNYPSQSPSISPNSSTFPSIPSRPFECDQCRLSFVRHHDLKRHRETHSGERPHICSACGKSYTRKDALVRHQVVKQCGEGSSRTRNKSKT